MHGTLLPEHLTSHIGLAAACDARRFRSVEEYERSGVAPEAPREVLSAMVRYATTHGLDLSVDGQDLGVIHYPTGEWIFDVHWSGIARICRRSGRWLPGRIELLPNEQGTADISASCWTRLSPASRQWVEVSTVARYRTHALRAVHREPSLAQFAPIGDWALAWEVPLSEVAQYFCARKALGDLVRPHPTTLTTIPVEVHFAVLQQRQQQQQTA